LKNETVLPANSGVVALRGCHLVLGRGDQLLAPLLAPERLGDQQRVLLPGVDARALDVPDHRCDRAELVVDVRDQRIRVGGHDQVRVQRGDLLQRDAVRGVEQLRPLGAERGLRPRLDPAVDVADLVHRDRRDAERDHRVGAGEVERDDPLGLALDRHAAELVRDRHREAA
jgi:hypothetical protein